MLKATPGITRRILLRAWRIARWPLAALLLLVITLFGINAVDDELSPQAGQMLRTPDNPYRDEDNAYVLLAGLDAPAGESMLERGRSNLLAFSTVLAAAPPGGQLDPEVSLTPADVAWRVDGKTLPWIPMQDSVWDWSRDNGATIAALAARYRELLARYGQLQAAAGYHETLPPHALVPMYSSPSALRKLYLAELARQVRVGGTDRQQALRSLGRDLDFWQRVLQGEGTLVSKMVSLAYLHADLLLLSDIVADRLVPLDEIQANVGEWLRPMSMDRWKIGKVFAAELRFQHESVKPIDENPLYSLELPGNSPTIWQRGGGWITAWFFLPNATMNQQAGRMGELRAMVDAGPHDLQQRLDALTRRVDEEALDFPAVLRNPVGKILTHIGFSAYSQYGMRAYDIASVQRAAVLAGEIRSRDIAPAEAPGFLAENPELARAADDSPLGWDPEAMELRVPQQARQRNDRRFSVRVARNGPG